MSHDALLFDLPRKQKKTSSLAIFSGTQFHCLTQGANNFCKKLVPSLPSKKRNTTGQKGDVFHQGLVQAVNLSQPGLQGHACEWLLWRLLALSPSEKHPRHQNTWEKKKHLGSAINTQRPELVLSLPWYLATPSPPPPCHRTKSKPPLAVFPSDFAVPRGTQLQPPLSGSNNFSNLDSQLTQQPIFKNGPQKWRIVTLILSWWQVLNYTEAFGGWDCMVLFKLSLRPSSRPACDELRNCGWSRCWLFTWKILKRLQTKTTVFRYSCLANM